MKIIMSRKEILDIAKKLNSPPGKNTKELQLDVSFFGLDPINDKVFSKFYLNDVIDKVYTKTINTKEMKHDLKKELNIDFGGKE